MADQKVPVTLLTGFLGAGKTTLLNHLLNSVVDQRIAVVVNEFGEVDIDGRLVVRSSEELIELRSGCICCTVRGDLQRTLAELLERRQRRLWRPLRFERILIEASGMASPGPVLQTLLVDPVLAEATTVDGVVTLAHAAHLPAQLTEHPEAVEQLAYADRVLLNHTDRVDAAGLAEASAAVARINPWAALRETVRGQAPVEWVLNIGGQRAEGWKLGAETHHHHHSHGVVSIALHSSAPLDLHRLKLWLQLISARRSWSLIRLKGILRCVDHPAPVVVHGVYQWLELGPGEGEAPQESVLVLIGKDLDVAELERGWAALG